MSEFKGTPGEWSLYVTGQWPETNHFYGIGCEGGTGQIAKIEGKGEEAEANARLMAESKNLLVVLQKIHAHGYTTTDDHAMVAEAIAAATGATP